MYSKKDLMPIKPEGHLFLHPKSYWTLNSRTKEQFGWTIDSTPFSSKTTEWIIPIPDAPDEVKPLKYPESKPMENGKYICHIKYWLVDGYALPLPEEWMIVGWDGDDWECVRKRVDYFIPIRLDKEENVSWRKSRIIRDGNGIGVLSDHFINLQESESVWFEENEWHIELVEWLDHEGYDVVKREPEIAPCPFCGGECHSIFDIADDDYPYRIMCTECRYNSKRTYLESEAIRLHNQIAGR